VSATTGPILAMGGIVAGNAIVIHNQPPTSQIRVAVATVITAAVFSAWERAMPEFATGVAWLALLAAVFVRANQQTPSPIESFAQWYNAK